MLRLKEVRQKNVMEMVLVGYSLLFGLKRFIYGLYPDNQIWRINLAFLILIFSVITSIFVKPKLRRNIIIFLIFIFPFIAIWLIGGFAIDIESLEIYIPILEEVDTRVWGGLSLTFIMAIFAMLFCFPIGIFLALGRRSDLPVIKIFVYWIYRILERRSFNYSVVYGFSNVSYVFTSRYIC